MMQRIFPEGIGAALTRGTMPFYLLVGQDPLLVDESKEKLISLTKPLGFDEKTEIAVANDTNWDQLFEQVQSGGLFFSRQILLLNLPETITAAQQKQLAELLGYTNPDLLFVLHLAKLTKPIEKQAWFSQISQQALQINCQTPDIAQLPTWLFHRANAMGLSIEQEAIQLLCYSYEGNLLALKQALQMLQLRYPDNKITLSRTQETIEQSSQFTPFQWIDALLEGKIARALRILTYLKHEETPPVILLRIIQKELMLLVEITRQPNSLTQRGQPLSNSNLRTEFDRLKVWKNRRMLYQQLISRLTYEKLYHLIQTLAQLEKKTKQEFSDDIWAELEHFSLGFR